MGGIDPTDRAGRRATDPNGATDDTLPGTDDTPGAYARPRAVVAGTVLAGRYRVECLLGKGGMGEVYAAHDTLADQPVAVKLVGARQAGAMRALLREELRASQALTHPNIARTHTLEEMDGELFIVMERLHGETLAERQKRGAIPVAAALAIVDQLLAALAAAHARGIVHRDVKPGNIMVCADGRVVLMDFGLARVDLADPDDGGDRVGTHSTSIKGTPAYMAPEVAAGLRADVRADLYAVGLILFELITGEPSFKAKSAEELLHRQLHDAIDVARAAAPERIARVISRLTAKDPAERYASADDVRAALAARAPANDRRRRVLRVAAMAIAILAAALGAGVMALYVVARAPAVSTRVDGSAGLPAERSHRRAEPRRLYDIGMTYLWAGRLDEARRWFEQCVRLDPAHRQDAEDRLREIDARLRDRKER